MKATPSETVPSARILLVDDNKLGLVARKTVLEEQGYRVTTAQDGQEAFERLVRDRFDLVITDYKMPKMNGLELITKIRGRQMEMPIILISGYADALGMTEAGTGATVVIAKSAAEVPQLIRSVNRLLRRPAQKKPVGSQRSQIKIKRQGAS